MTKIIAFEDLGEGDRIAWGSKTVSREEIIEFASEFDPAPFHLDDEAAAHTPLGRLSASGLHSCALAMRLMCDAFFLKSTAQGAFGIDKCRWVKPVFPDDMLSGSTRIVSKRLSASRPGIGIVDCLHEMTNQDGDIVLSMTNTGLMRTRDGAEKSADEKARGEKR